MGENKSEPLMGMLLLSGDVFTLFLFFSFLQLFLVCGISIYFFIQGDVQRFVNSIL